MLTLLRMCIRNQRGAETVEWIVVGVLLALVAAAVFGPSGDGVLRQALDAGIQNIRNIIADPDAAAPGGN